MTDASEHLRRLVVILTDPLFQPVFTCSEADTIYAAIASVSIDLADRFMVAHAATDDDDCDRHQVAEGTRRGWMYRR